MWQGLLPRVLSTDLDVILSSPEHLELFLLARKKAPAKLQKAMGSVNLFSDENLPRYGGAGGALTPLDIYATPPWGVLRVRP